MEGAKFKQPNSVQRCQPLACLKVEINFFLAVSRPISLRPYCWRLQAVSLYEL